MPHVDIPQDLFQQIQQILSASENADQFVQAAVREKIAWKERGNEFRSLSELTKQAMLEHGLTEDDLLEDFEKQRRLAGE